MPPGRIHCALFLLGCAVLCTPQAGAQFTGPKPPPPPPIRPVTIPAEPGALPPNQYGDPCEANAATVNFDACYADQFKGVDQDLNRLYRNVILAFEADIVDAHKRSDRGQLHYDATALLDLKNAQTEWTKYRDLECDAAGQQLQGGSIRPIIVNKCLILITRHRIDDIRAAYEIGGRNIE